MSRALYLLALFLAACGGGGDDTTVIYPVFTTADTLDSFEVGLEAKVRAAPRPAVITSCGFGQPRLHRIQLVAARHNVGVVGCS